MATNNILDLFRLTDRVALVTGGSRGLGAAMAEALANAGASVVITSTNDEEIKLRAQLLAKATGQNIIGISGDVSREHDCEKIVDATQSAFGRLDILVNNAGINVRGAIGELSLEEFERSLAVNVTGSWLMCRSAKRLLEQSRSARVINLGSTLGNIGVANRTAYATSKGAVHQLTRALAMEWSSIPINVNAIAPGPFLTDMNIPFQYSEHAMRVIEQEIALKRWAELHEIFGALLYLASDASSYTTGSILVVDGGWTAH